MTRPGITNACSWLCKLPRSSRLRHCPGRSTRSSCLGARSNAKGRKARHGTRRPWARRPQVIKGFKVGCPAGKPFIHGPPASRALVSDLCRELIVETGCARGLLQTPSSMDAPECELGGTVGSNGPCDRELRRICFTWMGGWVAKYVVYLLYGCPI